MFAVSSIRNRGMVLFAALVLALLVFVLAGIGTALVYPRPEWPEEIPVHAGIAGVLTFFVTLPMVDLMRKNRLLYEQLQARADTDPLTNVATRRLFFEQLEAHPERTGVSLMVDIDHFKSVNDTHGHIVGDRAIQTVAEVLSAQIRSTDIICRFGGEEFAVFLRDSTPDRGAEIAERMRRGVEAANVQCAGQAVSVSVSIGVSQKKDFEDISASLIRADDALYRAKTEGRNRVSLAWPTFSRPISESFGT